MIWRPMVAQKLPLVCYKADSDEIVGANMLFVLTKSDDFLEQIYKRVSFRCFEYCHPFTMNRHFFSLRAK